MTPTVELRCCAATSDGDCSGSSIFEPSSDGAALKVTSWKECEALLGRALNDVVPNVNERVVVLSESAFPSYNDRERLAQILFETYDVAGSQHPFFKKQYINIRNLITILCLFVCLNI